MVVPSICCNCKILLGKKSGFKDGSTISHGICIFCRVILYPDLTTNKERDFLEAYDYCGGIVL